MVSVELALERLRESDHQETDQRVRVVELCFDHDGHFTADDLDSLVGASGTPSRATIYNTLPLLVDVGILRELPETGSRTHYEIKRQAHPHARCVECGDILDLDVDLARQFDDLPEGFEPRSIHLILEGSCAECGSTEETRRPASLA